MLLAAGGSRGVSVKIQIKICLEIKKKKYGNT